MKLREEMPHVRAMCRDGSAWMLAEEERERFLAEWQMGRAFWTGMDIYDNIVVIKLADIVGVSLWDEHRLAIAVEERAELKRRELTDAT